MAIRGGGGSNSCPGCATIHDVPGKKVDLDEFFCFLKCFFHKTGKTTSNNDEENISYRNAAVARVVCKEALAQPISA